MKFWRSNNRERVCLTFVIQTLSVSEWIRTTEGINQQIYSLPIWPLWYSPDCGCKINQIFRICKINSAFNLFLTQS